MVKTRDGTGVTLARSRGSRRGRSFRYSFVVTVVLIMPVAVLLSFIPLRMLGINANIMSLAGVLLTKDASAALLKTTFASKSPLITERCVEIPRSNFRRSSSSFAARVCCYFTFYTALTRNCPHGRIFWLLLPLYSPSFLSLADLVTSTYIQLIGTILHTPLPWSLGTRTIL